MTLQKLRQIVKDHFARETPDTMATPSNDAILDALNSAKDRVVELVEITNNLALMQRKDYSVTVGDASITLPDGTTDPPWRRIARVTKVESGVEYEFDVRDQRSFEIHSCLTTMYLEGGKLYFSDVNGAPETMTVRVRYIGGVADLDGTDSDASYATLTSDWVGLIWRGALVELLPADERGFEKWSADYAQRAASLQVSRTRPIHTRPLRVGLPGADDGNYYPWGD